MFMCVLGHSLCGTKNTQTIGGIVLGLGGWQNLCFCVFGSFLMGEKKSINKMTPRKSRTIPRKECLCFFLGWYFPHPNYGPRSARFRFGHGRI